MSTQLYAIRCSKRDLWETVRYAREYYKKHHPIYSMLNTLVDTFQSDRDQAISTLDSLHKLAGQHETTLQLFEIGGDYVIRILEAGYFFMNHCKDIFPPNLIAVIHYDDRVDVTIEMKLDKPVVDQIDLLITAKEYLLYPLVDEKELSDEFFKLL